MQIMKLQLGHGLDQGLDHGLDKKLVMDPYLDHGLDQVPSVGGIWRHMVRPGVVTSRRILIAGPWVGPGVGPDIWSDPWV